MAQKFIQGKINWLTWKMVDATDFATPESALSAATVIKIYAVNNGSSTVPSCIKSGTGSLTKDIIHVGPSAIGQYAICLTTSDLSGTGASFYDLYVVDLSATGAARQTLVVPGERTDSSRISNTLSYLSDIVSNINSQLVAGTFALGASNLSDISSRVSSDIESRLGYTLSDFGSKVNAIQNSRLSGMSDILSQILADTTDISDVLSKTYALTSNANSVLVATLTPATVAAKVWSDYASMVGATASDVYSTLVSMLTAVNSDVNQVNSRVLLTQSRVSDILIDTADISDIVSKTYALASNANSVLVATLTPATIATKVWSDFESKVGSTTSDIYSTLTAGGGGASTSAIAAKVWSDFSSKVGSTVSDLFSTITAGGGGATPSAIAAQVWSDYASKVGATASDVYSTLMSMLTAVNSDVNQVNSRVLLNQSRISDILIDTADISDILSKVNARTTGMSDILSAVYVDTTDISAVLSDFYSDFQSRVPKAVATNSQLSDIGSKLSNVQSDIYSLLSNVHADLADVSNITSNVHLDLTSVASNVDDIESAIAAGVTLTAANARLVADSLLNRNLAGGGSGNTRNVRNSLRGLRNQVGVAAGVYRVYEEDDTTVAYSGATSTAAGNPLVKVNPD